MPALSAESDKSTHKSLYRLAAMMVKKGVLRLNDVYVHLTPTDPDARENEEARRVWHAFESLDAELRECFARAAAECEGCKRNDGSYNCAMPAVLEPAAPWLPSL